MGPPPIKQVPPISQPQVNLPQYFANSPYSFYAYPASIPRPNFYPQQTSLIMNQQFLPEFNDKKMFYQNPLFTQTQTDNYLKFLQQSLGNPYPYPNQTNYFQTNQQNNYQLLAPHIININNISTSGNALFFQDTHNFYSHPSGIFS